jgi:hypothetical protein
VREGERGDQGRRKKIREEEEEDLQKRLKGSNHQNINI